MTDSNEPDSGPGCFTVLLLIVTSSLLIMMVSTAEMRLERIETKLGMPHCGIFNSATWDGHSCKETRK